MPTEVIMPALGMAQESGVIVAWLKAPGDAVKAGEALMEVETDKAVMEVEAQADGFLSDVRASEGDDVPVGQVIAVIADTADAVAAPAARAEIAPAAKAEVPPEPPAEPAPAPAGPAVSRATVPAGQGHGRILASPKARRLAKEQGLDLARLAEAGHPQPYRVIDIDRLATLAPVQAAGATAATARATLPSDAWQRFLDLLAAETEVEPAAVIAAFAAGAFRAATGAAAVTVRLSAPRSAAVHFADPDIGGLSALEPSDTGAAPDLVVHDLTGTRLSQVHLSATGAPALSVAREGDRIVIALAATPAQMKDEALIACLDGLAGRFDDPLRHLL